MTNDIYYAENHILKALPGIVRKAGSKKLRDALDTHR
jgi:ferritin-like metal-binding protein YciE